MPEPFMSGCSYSGVVWVIWDPITLAAFPGLFIWPVLYVPASGLHFTLN